MNSTQRKEQLALASVDSVPKLLKRFRQAIRCLHSELAKAFRPVETCTLDFAKQRMYSTGPRLYYLQWQLREHPELPESYENQQTTSGSVTIHHNA